MTNINATVPLSVLPRSGEKVSRLGFGAMGLSGMFGSQDDDYMVRSILMSLEKGINFIDTARAYGRSEELVGKAIKQWRGDKPFIATKAEAMAGGGGRKHPGAAWHEPHRVEEAFPPGSIRASLEKSLQELQLECVDLLQLHKYWPIWDRTDYWMEELLRLKEEGKTRFVGISAIDHRHDLTLSLIRSGHIDFLQALFNIFDSTALDAVIPECQEHDVAFIARIILDEGGLTGFLRQDTVFNEGDFRRSYFDVLPRETYMSKVDALRSYVPEHAGSLAELAIRFALQDPGVTVAITSMQVHEYAEQNIAASQQPPLANQVYEELCYQHRWIRNFYHARRYL
ncbi:aldo/keto reductase [Paenibacillus qinlingensis]|uniref:Aryl-alcohol dehydrogenase-like predicted oxidoreductase n=1 Tax=Paenibacillus qinlingensis TaxID=1837343 RepID=A0ABU1NSI8_9BACL|nr:aldo/keto reductase [Paenibacillus qinlingensis]MDR6550443.1 aryl-alcohol dehydrogenase-like predicted oxidoreductase [Paenibacillus qinlingensis]